MLKAIVFDVDDTLYDQKPSFDAAFKQVFSNNFDNKLIAKIFSNYVRQERLVVAKNNLDNQLQLSKADISFHCLHHSFKAFSSESLTRQKAAEFWRLYSELSQKIQLFDGLATVFNRLFEKFKLGIITNGKTETQLSKITRLNLHHWFSRENIITSEEVNAQKPDPMIFTLMNRKFKLRGSEMMYVGSSYLNDIVPAKKAGWQAVWYNNHDSSIVDPTIIPDQTVNNSLQLQELLLELAAEV